MEGPVRLGLRHFLSVLAKMYERRCRGVARMPKIRVTSLGGPCQFVYIFHKIQIEKLSVYNDEIDCV